MVRINLTSFQLCYMGTLLEVQQIVCFRRKKMTAYVDVYTQDSSLCHSLKQLTLCWQFLSPRPKEAAIKCL